MSTCEHDRQDDVCWECKDDEIARLANQTYRLGNELANVHLEVARLIQALLDADAYNGQLEAVEFANKELQAKLKEATHEAKLNATMLSRQTVLAREAETKAEIARRNSRDNWELLMDSHKERDAIQAKLAEAERENVRLAQEHTQCHEQNSRLVSEHYTLRTENASLREDVRALAEALRNAADCYDPDNLTMQTRYAAWMRVLARPTVRKILEGT